VPWNTASSALSGWVFGQAPVAVVPELPVAQLFVSQAAAAPPALPIPELAPFVSQ
jgi:hypothetical protein